jgi:hypothetical protein
MGLRGQREPSPLPHISMKKLPTKHIVGSTDSNTKFIVYHNLFSKIRKGEIWNGTIFFLEIYSMNDEKICD